MGQQAGRGVMATLTRPRRLDRSIRATLARCRRLLLHATIAASALCLAVHLHPLCRGLGTGLCLDGNGLGGATVGGAIPLALHLDALLDGILCTRLWRQQLLEHGLVRGEGGLKAVRGQLGAKGVVQHERLQQAQRLLAHQRGLVLQPACRKRGQGSRGRACMRLQSVHVRRRAEAQRLVPRTANSSLFCAACHLCHLHWRHIQGKNLPRRQRTLGNLGHAPPVAQGHGAVLCQVLPGLQHRYARVAALVPAPGGAGTANAVFRTQPQKQGLPSAQAGTHAAAYVPPCAIFSTARARHRLA